MKRHALLVGIDCYLDNNGKRVFTDGGEVYLRNLKGCLHDVRMIEKLLLAQYDMSPVDITVLSSSLPSPVADIDDGADVGLEPVERSDPDRLPTFENIKREFESMRDRAVAGDFFLFHFSGHGALIPRVYDSPPSKEMDPSLLTVDFCRAGRAIRGWELNLWLKALNEKGVRVVVSLDSCYSGGAWRSGIGFRTPDDWGSRSVVNLPTDKDDSSVQPEFRAGELKTSWSLNPENFTLMTACGVDEIAAERSGINGQVGGHFTQALLEYLGYNNHRVTYRMALEHLQHVLHPQTPQIHGRDRFLFFGNSEPFRVTPLKTRVSGDLLHIPAGKAHGVHIGSEFVPFSSALCGTETFTVDSVEDFTSSARLSSGTRGQSQARGLLRLHNDTIVASRWCLAEGSVLRVVLDQGFEPAEGFKKYLPKALMGHLASAVQVYQVEDFADAAAPEDIVFTLQGGGQDGIKIRGPEELIGYNDPVRPLTIRGSDDVEELATAVASPLLHLSRFGNTLNLNSGYDLSFNVSLLPSDGTPEMPFYARGQCFTYIFDNTDWRDLFFVMLNLTPEFGIRQVWPSTDCQHVVKPGKRFKSPSIRFEVPDAPAEIRSLLHHTSRREIIRTLVTTRDGVSWKMLEMPSIWDASGVDTTELDGRDAVFQACEDSEWLVFDNRIVLDG